MACHDDEQSQKTRNILRAASPSCCCAFLAWWRAILKHIYSSCSALKLQLAVASARIKKPSLADDAAYCSKHACLHAAAALVAEKAHR